MTRSRRMDQLFPSSIQTSIEICPTTLFSSCSHFFFVFKSPHSMPSTGGSMGSGSVTGVLTNWHIFFPFQRLFLTGLFSSRCCHTHMGAQIRLLIQHAQD